MLNQAVIATAPSQRRIGSAGDAQHFVLEMNASIENMMKVLALETDLMKAGRIRDALALDREKNEISGQYLRFMQTLKENAIAIARFAPADVEALKKNHAHLTSLLALNQQVIATVKSVSENLVRGVQEEASAARSLSTYGPGAHVARHTPAHAPLALSVKL